MSSSISDWPIWEHVAYPLGLKDVVVGEGETRKEALADVKPVVKFYIESFGQEALDSMRVTPPIRTHW